MPITNVPRIFAALAASLLCFACGDDSQATASTTAPTASATASATSQATATASTGELTTTTDASATDTSAGTQSSGPETSSTTDSSTSTTGEPTTAGGCDNCEGPGYSCIDDICVEHCQLNDPDACGPDQLCDVLSGECTDADASCTLSGPNAICGDQICGPGSVCDGLGSCIAIAPCSAVTCSNSGNCWGTACSCERAVDCQEASAELLNGPFADDIVGIDFADDCNAWSVTLSGGQEFLRRMTPDGELTTWGGIGDYDQGEVRVLRKLTIPQSTLPPSERFTAKATPPAPVEGLGEVALTYICCPTCGSCNNNPNARGVARLDENNVNMPLPIVLFAEPTQGMGPFENKWLDGGPQGLTWGENRVLYIGNQTANGDYNSADLEKGTVDVEYKFDARVTASAPISSVHILVALIGGDLYRFNTATKEVEFVVDLMSDITSLSHDAFTGDVYASLANLEVHQIDPFSAKTSTFATMPGKGRVAVSPSGKLWFTPVKYVENGTLSSWPLADSF